MKKILKTILLLLIIFIFFLWGKSVHIQQLTPVVLQLIQQQYKWKGKNTGTYVYKYICTNNSFGREKLSPYLLFIKNKKVQKAIHIGNGYDIDSLATKEQIESLYSNEDYDSYYLIDTRFNDVWSALWSNSFSFYVEYEKKDGHPKVLSLVETNPNEKKIVLCGDNTLNKYSLELKMFDKNTEFNNDFLKKILKEYKEKDFKKLRCKHEPSQCEDINQTSLLIEKVGGNKIRGVISKSYTSHP